MGDTITTSPSYSSTSTPTIDGSSNSGTIDTTTIFNNITIALNRPEFRTLLASILGLPSSAPTPQILNGWRQLCGTGCQSPNSILTQYFGICPETPDPCVITGTDCRSVALAAAVKYYFAQRDVLRYLLLQLSILCQALTTCNGNTPNVARRAAQSLRAIINQTCSYPLIIPNVTTYCATLTGTGGTSGLGYVLTTTTPTVLPCTIAAGSPLNFAFSGTINIAGLAIPFSGTAVSAVEVASTINTILDNFNCGMFGCVTATPINRPSIDITGFPTSPPTTYTFDLSVCTPTGLVTNTTSYQATTYAELAAAINADPAVNGAVLATATTNSITLINTSGGNLALTYIPPGAAATTLLYIGVVQICAPLAFTLSGLSATLSSTTPLSATATGGLLTEYCPQYTSVHTFTCDGVDYVVLEAPRLPINTMLAYLNDYLAGLLSPEDLEILQEASCNLINLVKTYLANVNGELLNLYALKRTLVSFTRYCEDGTTDCYDFVITCPSACPPCPTPCPAPCPTPCPAPCSTTTPCPTPCPAPCSTTCPTTTCSGTGMRSTTGSGRVTG